MGKKVAFLSFKGEQSCFIHALLNVLDAHEKGMDSILIIEGPATGLIKELVNPENPLHELYLEAKNKGLIKAICKGCAKMMGTLDIAKKEDLPISGEMSNHVPLADYALGGYEIITF